MFAYFVHVLSFIVTVSVMALKMPKALKIVVTSIFLVEGVLAKDLEPILIGRWVLIDAIFQGL